MTERQEAYITPTVLIWAREQLCLTPRAAAGKVGVRPSDWDAWESGQQRPTMEQAREIAEALRFPMGCLWLPKRPDEYPSRVSEPEPLTDEELATIEEIRPADDVLWAVGDRRMGTDTILLRLVAEVRHFHAALDRDRCVCVHNHDNRHESQCEELRAAVDRIREIAGLPND